MPNEEKVLLSFEIIKSVTGELPCLQRPRVLSIRTIRQGEEFEPTSLTQFLTVQAVSLSSSWFLVLHQTQGKKTSFFSSFPNKGWCITYMSYYVVKLCLSGLSRTISVLSQKSSGFVHEPFLWSCLLSPLRRGVGVNETHKFKETTGIIMV